MAGDIDKDARARMQQLTENLPSKSAKIRALAKEGISRADIARFLDIRYQHVRNVLVSAEEKEQARYEAPQEAGVPKPAWAQVGTDGRILLPAPFRRALGIENGGQVMMRIEEGELRLIGRDAAVARAQALVGQVVPDGVSLADALIAERRSEVTREDRDG